mmetsp:Transcript_412/g.1837  ORF Transcript_412/g.1837 Transcript_412/m.1837 type:complete len:306 (+) Transcript_412:3-920(+)
MCASTRLENRTSRAHRGAVTTSCGAAGETAGYPFKFHTRGLLTRPPVAASSRPAQPTARAQRTLRAAEGASRCGGCRESTSGRPRSRRRCSPRRRRSRAARRWRTRRRYNNRGPRQQPPCPRCSSLRIPGPDRSSRARNSTHRFPCARRLPDRPRLAPPRATFHAFPSSDPWPWSASSRVLASAPSGTPGARRRRRHPKRRSRWRRCQRGGPHHPRPNPSPQPGGRHPPVPLPPLLRLPTKTMTRMPSQAHAARGRARRRRGRPAILPASRPWPPPRRPSWGRTQARPGRRGSRTRFRPWEPASP